MRQRVGRCLVATGDCRVAFNAVTRRVVTSGRVACDGILARAGAPRRRIRHDGPRLRGLNEGFVADLHDTQHGPGSAQALRSPAGLPALLRRQDALQTAAQAVIRELSLRERLGRLGRFEHIGSSRSGLMVWRDLDVAARCADPTTEAVLDAMRPVLAHPGVREVMYMPQLGSRSPSGGPADQRWYFVLRYAAAGGELWKVDVSLWRLGDAPREPSFDADTLRRRLTDETRGAILWIKDVWHHRPCYPDVVGAVEIYDAVLNHGVRAPAGFAAYLRARGMPAD
jgi:hypothetical protein